jgi:hypothetical protein
MTVQPQPRKLGSTLAASLAALALAAPAASAQPIDVGAFVDPSASACEEQWLAAYGTPAPRPCSDQALASRGVGAATRTTDAMRNAPRSVDAAFDWDSAAIGAGGAAALLALGSLAAMAAGGPNRVRTAR